MITKLVKDYTIPDSDSIQRVNIFVNEFTIIMNGEKMAVVMKITVTFVKREKGNPAPG